MRTHSFNTRTVWTGNTGSGTSSYRAYDRSHTLSISGKPDIECSSDVAFRGDASKHNPEDFFVGAISNCHMLWYLHLCADAGITVTAYEDNAEGVMETDDFGGKFTIVVLHPNVAITDATRIRDAEALHQLASQKCFISNSCNFPIDVVPNTTVA